MYYPKSQIKTNLYTNGGDLINSSTQESYSGYYYELSTGQKYTGKTPQDGPNILLSQFNPNSPIEFKQTFEPEIILTQDESSNGIYPFDPPIRSIPQFNPTLPTTQNQQNGQFNRYFCKRTNENRYMEIDFNTYSQLQSQDPNIAWDLYNPTLIIWLIQGNREQVYNSNKGSVQSVEQNLKWYGFSQYFKDDFSKYYLGF
jgi:hypothetical protein